MYVCVNSERDRKWKSVVENGVYFTFPILHSQSQKTKIHTYLIKKRTAHLLKCNKLWVFGAALGLVFTVWLWLWLYILVSCLGALTDQQCWWMWPILSIPIRIYSVCKFEARGNKIQIQIQTKSHIHDNMFTMMLSVSLSFPRFRYKCMHNVLLYTIPCDIQWYTTAESTS